MTIFESIVMAASLCADCFAVSLCSSVTLKKKEWSSIFRLALAFALIQSGLLAAGWAFGYLFVGLVEKIAHILGFLLLLYVGGGMLREGIGALRGREPETRNLNGLRNIVIAGVATSIDALAVGVSQSITGVFFTAFIPLLVSVAVITALSVVAGITGGRMIGLKFGTWAEIVGGAVLVGIGICVLCS